MPRPCLVCGAANATCGGPTTMQGIGGELVAERIDRKMATNDLVRVETAPGILTKMTPEQAAKFEEFKSSPEWTERTKVLSPYLLGAVPNAAGVIETKPVEPDDTDKGRQSRRPLQRPVNDPAKPTQYPAEEEEEPEPTTEPAPAPTPTPAPTTTPPPSSATKPANKG